MLVFLKNKTNLILTEQKVYLFSAITLVLAAITFQMSLYGSMLYYFIITCHY